MHFRMVSCHIVWCMEIKFRFLWLSGILGCTWHLVSLRWKGGDWERKIGNLGFLRKHWRRRPRHIDSWRATRIRSIKVHNTGRLLSNSWDLYFGNFRLRGLPHIIREKMILIKGVLTPLKVAILERTL